MKKSNVMCWADLGSEIKITMQFEFIHKSEAFLCTDVTPFIDNSFYAVITSFSAVLLESHHAIEKLNNFSSSIAMHPSIHCYKNCKCTSSKADYLKYGDFAFMKGLENSPCNNYHICVYNVRNHSVLLGILFWPTVTNCFVFMSHTNEVVKVVFSFLRKRISCWQ
jgi:hypothetical protein